MPATARLTIKYLPLPEVLRAPRNPNEHSLPGIRASMARHGFASPVLLDSRTGRLLDGHGRLDVLAELHAEGAKPPQRITVKDGQWHVPVVVGLHTATDDEAMALQLALLNLPKTPIESPDALGTMAAMLDELAQRTELGLEGTGHTADTLDDLLAQIEAGRLADQGTDAAHAPLPERGAPGTPREQQGLHEVGLMFSAEAHAEYMEHLARLKRAWGITVGPTVVLRALREAAAREG